MINKRWPNSRVKWGAVMARWQWRSGGRRSRRWDASMRWCYLMYTSLSFLAGVRDAQSRCY